jgi:hypothetical protein
MRTRAVAAVAVAVLLLGACGDDDGDDAGGTTSTTPSTETTETTEATTTSTAEATTSTSAAAGCPDEAPVPGTATDVQTAPVAFDGDGDGQPDDLTVFRFEGAWWVQVEWAAGGSGAVTIDGADMGARPLGGFDLDGDGTDEVWVAISGPASGSLVGVFRVLGCGLWPVLDASTGQPFAFPVTSSIGSFSGASCESIGDVALVNGELVDSDTGQYETGETPYEYDASSGEVTAGFGDGGSASFDEVGGLATLACGSLGDAL